MLRAWAQREYGRSPSLPLFPCPLPAPTCFSRPALSSKGLERAHCYRSRAGSADRPPPRGSRGRAGGCPGTGHGAPGPCVAVGSSGLLCGHCPRPGCWRHAAVRAPEARSAGSGRREQRRACLLQQRRAVDAEARGCRNPEAQTPAACDPVMEQGHHLARLDAVQQLLDLRRGPPDTAPCRWWVASARGRCSRWKTFPAARLRSW